MKISSADHQCEDCGKLIRIAVCPHCLKWFIDWRLDGEDDVMSSARYAQDGTLLCVSCAGDHDKNETDFGDEGYIPDDYT